LLLNLTYTEFTISKMFNKCYQFRKINSDYKGSRQKVTLEAKNKAFLHNLSLIFCLTLGFGN